MLERWIRAREYARWSAENRRLTHPFAWGIEHLGGDSARDDPRAFLTRYAAQALADSDRFFAVTPAPWYKLAGDLLTFPSALESAFPENNIVFARLFPTRSQGRMVIVLPHWHADWESHVNVCRFLNRFGLSAVRLSLPYHDRRMPPGLERADYMVSPNIGLTLQASRQAVLDARRLVHWLRQQGYTKLAILGTSLGSSVAFVTLAHEPALRAGVFLHVSTYFGDVVRTGLTTAHVWAGLKGQVSADELRHFWAPISPYPYVDKLVGTGKRCLLVSGRYDPSFLPEFSRAFWTALRQRGVPYELLLLPCGHYTLGSFPFNYWAGFRCARFLRRTLA